MARNRFSGRERFDRILRRMGPEARAAMHKSLLKSGNELAAAQRALAPVDDGDLRASIRVIDGLDNVSAEGRAFHRLRVVENDLSVFVAAGDDKAYYAPFVEFGTVSQPAQPFFLPAYRIMKKRITNRARLAARRAAKKAAAGK